jgi:hypothetical protein
MPTSRRPAPRSLADDLRARSDDELVALLLDRPDLAHPVPGDTTSLAARASTRASVQRALDALDTPTLEALTALATLPNPTTKAALAKACGAKVDAQLETLRRRALVWGTDRQLRLVRTVPDVLGPYPAGLGPTFAELATGVSPSRIAGWCGDLGVPPSGDPVTDARAIADLLADTDEMRRLLDDAPDGTSQLLDRLTWDGPVGTVSNAERTVRAREAQGAVDWLLAHALLVPLDGERVVLPREAGVSLRGGRVLRELHTAPADVESVAAQSARRVDNAATGTAAEAMRLLHELGELWGRVPAAVLRGGGLGVRELRRAATALDVDDSHAARVLEIAYAAGLVAQDGDISPSWMPTPFFDDWSAMDTAGRWAHVASAWLLTSRVAALVGTRDSRDSVRNALSDSVERPAVVRVRQAVLTVLAGLEPGTAPTRESLADQLRWRQPRGPAASQPQLVEAVLEDAAWLGVTGLGALSSAGRALVDPDADTAATLAALLPAEVTEVLLQADLTAVAPGPLASELRSELSLMADVESRGGATVYRFRDSSIRRALDAGRTADDVLGFLSTHSRTPVPQPLEYLVKDAARRHGLIRVGTASAYLRSDDEAVLGELLADRRTAVLRLRRLAPTVLAAQADPHVVLQTLREIGLAPAAEGADGALMLRRPDERRTPPRQRPRPVGVGPRLEPSLAEAVVEGLRRGDAEPPPRSAEGNGPPTPPMDPATSLAELRAAAADRRRMWMGITDPAGQVTRRLVEPLGVSAGRITVFDHGVGEVRTVSVHRVTGVAPAEENGSAKP